MARQPRIDYPGAVHHVMNRGADKQTIFRDDDDRHAFLEIWAKATSRFGIIVSSYCFMGNHYHVLLESPAAQLSRSLQFVAKNYTQAFNKRHGRDGALFRGRFHSVVVDSETYYSRVVRYIELNPVEAGLATLASLPDYPWSSFQYLIGRRPTPSWLSTGRILSPHGSGEAFDKFVRSGLSDNDLAAFYTRPLQPGRVLGDVRFARSVRDRIDEDFDVTPGIPWLGLAEIDRAVIETSGASPDTLRCGVRGKRNAERSLAVEIAYMATDSSLLDLAEHYEYATRQAVGSAIRSSRTSYEPHTAHLRAMVLDRLGLDEIGMPRPELQ